MISFVISRGSHTSCGNKEQISSGFQKWSTPLLSAGVLPEGIPQVIGQLENASHRYHLAEDNHIDQEALSCKMKVFSAPSPV